jgi:hypothetical protein
MIANGLMYRPLDIESSEASCQTQLFLGDGVGYPAFERRYGLMHLDGEGLLPL